MSSAGIVPGYILHCKDYEFEDGEKANKYFVVVGAKPGSNYLAVMATSKPHYRQFRSGCHADDGYFHIPGGRRDWFPDDTWLLLARGLELSAPELLRLSLKEKRITTVGNLRVDIANGIRKCMRNCHDVPGTYIDLL